MSSSNYSIEVLKDKQGSKIAPVTVTNAIYDTDGVRLDEKISKNVYSETYAGQSVEIPTIENQLNSLGNRLSHLETEQIKYLPLTSNSSVTVSIPELSFTGGSLFNNAYFGGGMITLRQKNNTDNDKCMLELYAHQRGSLYLGANDSQTYKIETNMENGFMINKKINVPSIQVGSVVEAVNGHLILKSLTTGSVQMESEVAPRVDNRYYLGIDALRWKAVYSAGGFIQPSDMRMKSDIRDIDDEIFFNLIKNTGVHSYVLNYPDMPENIKQEEAPREQVHVGIIAQEMEQYEGSEYVLNIDKKGHFSVNNYNLTSAIMAALKVEISKREELEKRLEKLESK